MRLLRDRLPPDVVVVSLDIGRVRTATHYAQCLGASVIMLHKRRESSAKTEVTRVVGDVSSRACLIVDDMVSTGGTVAEKDWPSLRVISIAPLIAGALERFLADGSIGDLY